MFNIVNEIKEKVDNVRSKGLQGTWLVQLVVEHVTLDLGVMNWSPTLEITKKKRQMTLENDQVHLKKNQKEFVEIKSIIIEIKNSVDRLSIKCS